MSAFLDGIGAVFSKITQWVPSKRESYQNQIERLLDENADLAKEYPLSSRAAGRIMANVDRIKQLRSKADKISG